MLDLRCPRCGGDFACGVNAGHCACFGIRLTDALRDELAANYRGCLCLPCLNELIDADQARQAAVRPAGASD
ncbi:cysteine-rich CWC family protein [Roseateles sp.]|uniref:cysteine-rich CWC family protein n=1 Tax=Roseateles sp. TaxID=1971397 RepID=UPI0039EC4031